MQEGEITNFMVLNTTHCMKKLFNRLEGFDCLFIDLPNNLEPYLTGDNIEEVAGVENLQYIRILKPFLHSMQLNLYCYKDLNHSIIAKQHAFELANLVLKAKLSKLNIDEWKKLISKDIKSSIQFAEYEAMYIIERSMEKNACINASELIEEILESEGFKVKRVWLSKFSRPIDRLYELVKMEISGSKIDDGEYERVIREHIRFVDAVIEKGYEEAVRLWL
jgi:hypothetical protein